MVEHEGKTMSQTICNQEEGMELRLMFICACEIYMYIELTVFLCIWCIELEVIICFSDTDCMMHSCLLGRPFDNAREASYYKFQYINYWLGKPLK